MYLYLKKNFFKFLFLQNKQFEKKTLQIKKNYIIKNNVSLPPKNK